MEEKQALRSAVRAAVSSVPPEKLAEYSAAIRTHLVASPEWHSARIVGLFAALPSEPHLDALLEVAGDRLLCFPRVAGECLELYAVNESADLVCGTGRVREPVPDPQKRIPHGLIDLLLVPGVAFTRDGHRLGRGGGYYDRFLAGPDLKAWTVGICFEEQIVPKIPLLGHDWPVHAVLTPAGFSRI